MQNLSLVIYEKLQRLAPAYLELVYALVSRLPERNTKTPKPILGAMPGLVLYMSDDFNAPLDDFNEYMPE